MDFREFSPVCSFSCVLSFVCPLVRTSPQLSWFFRPRNMLHGTQRSLLLPFQTVFWVITTRPSALHKILRFEPLKPTPLVTQSSATGVTVAAIPPCSAIHFRNPKVPRYPPPTPLRPLPAANERKVRHGDPERGATP